jgi:hypothetical protein
VGEEHDGAGAGGFFREAAEALCLNHKLPDALANETVYLFCYWFENVQEVNILDLPARQAEEFLCVKREFMALYRRDESNA